MTARALLAVAAGVALLATVAVLVLPSSSYTVHARFDHAGQLIEGGEVQVAGREIGSIGEITLTDAGEADVVLEIDEDDVTPLPEGTRATIRALSQSGVASRYVDLSLAPGRGATIPDGGVLPRAQTRSIVDLDELLNMFGPRQRRDVAALIDESAHVFAGSGAASWRSMLAQLDPALAEVQGMARELAHDRRTLGHLVSTAASASAALARDPSALEGAVQGTARTFGALADERDALADSLRRAPAVLRQASGTLRRTSAAVDAVRPALRDIPPVAGPLEAALRRAVPALNRSEPVVRSLVDQLPDLERSLRGLEGLERPGVDALRQLAPALEGARPILTGLRYYAPDFLLGVTNGLAGLLGSNYNDAGHYARLTFLQTSQTSLSGIPSSFLTQFPLVPGVLDWRTGLDAPCPGSAAPPAPDLSNVYVPDPSLCDPSHGIPASVNVP